MKIFFAILLAVIIGIILVPMLLSPTTDNQRGAAVTGLPWQIEALPDGASRVAGLTLGGGTLADARSRFGADSELAIVIAPGETGSLECYFENATLGAVTGKLILTADVPPATIAGMLQRAVKAEYMQSSTKKITLSEQDRTVAWTAPIKAMAFMPSINLDEGIILQRFGQPAERIWASAQVEHLLYPKLGLDIVLDTEGKELLQYVAPRDFARLREPLKAQGEKP